ncbi:UNVERIFIED_CONTAM: hypothetical protein PYX00_000785 [Menopon gallinae]|uniref:Uncharacterized protein n=1 Tax=Menopon gallinae TaxID=328185 RepID=A0AAW2IBP3_9NEOP
MFLLFLSRRLLPPNIRRSLLNKKNKCECKYNHFGQENFAVKPENMKSFGPCQILKDSIKATAAFVLFRPLLVSLAIAVIALLLAATRNRRMQTILLSLPYHRLYRTIRSEKMITFYAAVLEVIFEVITAVILAGVSIVITSWLLFEEAADRRQRVPMNLKASSKPTSCLMKREQEQESLKYDMQQEGYMIGTSQRLF